MTAVSAPHLGGTYMPPTAHVGGIACVGGGNVPPPRQQATGIMALPHSLGTSMSHVAPFAGGTILPTGNALGSAMLGLLPQPQAGIVGMQPLPPPPRLPASNDVATQIGLVAGAALGALAAAAAHQQQNQQQGQQANPGMAANIVQQAVFALQQQQQQTLMNANALPPGGGGGVGPGEGAGIPLPRHIDLSAVAGNMCASLLQHQANGATVPPPSGSAPFQPLPSVAVPAGNASGGEAKDAMIDNSGAAGGISPS